MAINTVDDLKPASTNPLPQDENTRRRRANAAICMNEVATLARQLDREFYFSLEELFGDVQVNERADLFLSRVRNAIAQMGYLSDLASAQIGGVVCIGGAEDWLLPPVFDPTVSRGVVDAAADARGAA